MADPSHLESREPQKKCLFIFVAGIYHVILILVKLRLIEIDAGKSMIPWHYISHLLGLKIPLFGNTAMSGLFWGGHAYVNNGIPHRPWCAKYICHFES